MQTSIVGCKVVLAKKHTAFLKEICVLTGNKAKNVRALNQQLA